MVKKFIDPFIQCIADIKIFTPKLARAIAA